MPFVYFIAILNLCNGGSVGKCLKFKDGCRVNDQ